VNSIETPAVLDFNRLSDVTMNDGELMRELVSTLVDDTSQQIRLLATAVHSKDAWNCARLAHYSKGACSNIGANAVAAVLKDLEQKAKLGDFERCEGSLANLQAEFDRLRAEAEVFVAGNGA
jgi:HPt (histidine-containing phosphotransfer) domain-containing protein